MDTITLEILTHLNELRNSYEDNIGCYGAYWEIQLDAEDNDSKFVYVRLTENGFTFWQSHADGNQDESEAVPLTRLSQLTDILSPFGIEL